MADRWLIVADDLTGAADSAIAFAKRRLPARVTWGALGVDPLADDVAVAFDADTRQQPPDMAARRHREVLQRLFEPRRRVYKKMDSTLRGHPAEETGALVDVLAAHDAGLRTVFAPAFPAGGRTTRGGRVFVHGVPLEHTAFWDRARPAAHADLVTLLEAAGLHARLVPLATLRGDPLRLRAALDPGKGSARIFVCDAEEGADLDRIAAAALDDVPTLFAGSAGLAHSLAAHASRDGSPRVETTALGVSTRGALLVIGSQAGPSRAALEGLAGLAGLRRVSVAAGPLLEDPVVDERLVTSGLESVLNAGVDVLVDVAPPEGGALAMPRVVEALARRLAPVAAAASALMATGGDTAAALLGGCGVRGIRLIDELEPGTSLGLTWGALSVPVVTKSGGFGNAASLRRIVERLRFIRQTGTIA
jgi:D-threonate/D-erythronate kinase